MFLNIEVLDFIVIDTEGTRELREIAIINSDGKLIYEAFNQEHPEYIHQTVSNKLLKSILLDFTAIACNKILVFHNALHDLKVLKRSFKTTITSLCQFQKFCPSNFLLL